MDAILKNKTQKTIKRRHPWVFSGGIASSTGDPAAGDLVRAVDGKGRFLAWGHWNPDSRISLRLLSWEEEEHPDLDWWKRRLADCVKSRRLTPELKNTNAARLVFSESDGAPGLIVDQYNDILTLQALTPGIDRIKNDLALILAELTGVKTVYERSDADARTMEGLSPNKGPLLGGEPDGPTTINENGFQFLVDVGQGQKTGFFLDQRENRMITARRAQGMDVLDCFSHTFGFCIYAAGAGAKSITRIESSEEAAKLGEANLELNGFKGLGETVIGDVFKQLRLYRDQGRMFDLIVLDPPKFAPTKAHAPKAARAYKDVNLLAFKLLRPGGVLSTFSCSAGVNDAFFQQIIFGAGLDADRRIQIIGRMGQAADHPVLLSFPESSYLKGLLCRAA